MMLNTLKLKLIDLEYLTNKKKFRKAQNFQQNACMNWFDRYNEVIYISVSFIIVIISAHKRLASVFCRNTRNGEISNLCLIQIGST